MTELTHDGNHPVVFISFDDDYAARFVQELESVCPTVHVSPFMRAISSTIESLRPSIAIFDIHTIKTEELSIFDIMQALETSHPEIRKIALGHQTASAEVIAAMKAGACDFIDRDAAPQDIRDTVSHQLQHRGPMIQTDRKGYVVALVSGRDNEGEGELAANLAAFVAKQREPGEVLLLDFNLETSRFEIDFDMEITYSVRDAIDELSRLDKAVLKDVLPKHESGLYLLPLVIGEQGDQAISPQELATVLSTLRPFFSIIFINAGCLRHKSCQPYLLPLCDHVVLICPQLIGAVKCARDLIADDMLRSNPQTKFGLVVSHHDPGITLTPTQISASIGLPLIGTTPADRTALANCHNAGKPLVLNVRRSKYARAIQNLALSIFGEVLPERATNPIGNGLTVLSRMVKGATA